MDIGKIMEALPHRYPFLLVDRILEMEGNKVVGLKNVTINEPFFQGHFPGKPIMPGVLIIEALAQTAGALILGKEEIEDKIPMFISIEEAKFRKPVLPGDQLILEVEITKRRGRVAIAKGVARVGDSVAAEAQMGFILADKGSI